jgi:hypothetical protein
MSQNYQANSIQEYLQDLLRNHAASTPDAPPSDRATVEAWRSANRPLIDRLRDLLKQIPLEVQRDGVALRDLQARLKGRQGLTCSHVELGACLRQLGFHRERAWNSSQQGFRAVWQLRSVPSNN